MKSLPVRLISALVVLFTFAIVYFLFASKGVFTLGLMACLVGCYEYMRLTLRPLAPSKPVQWLYLINCFIVFGLNIFLDNLSFVVIPLVIVYYIFCTLWLLAPRFENQKILQFVSYSILGFVYSALLPSYALKLLHLPNGILWFIFLLGVVFSGDVFAYFGGILLGKEKIMPQISPSKTVAGAVCGMLGSILFGLCFHYFAPLNLSAPKILLVCIAAGSLAQTGDLFESLLKRVATVKDSGQIMPGHGGSLDRFDGVYFAAPLIYALAIATLKI